MAVLKRSQNATLVEDAASMTSWSTASMCRYTRDSRMLEVVVSNSQAKLKKGNNSKRDGANLASPY